MSLAPVVFAAVGHRASRSRTVADGLAGSAWIQDISVPLNAQDLAKFLRLADSLASVSLHPGQEDVLRWTWSSAGVYSAKSAFLHFFANRPSFAPWSQIW